MEPAYTLLNCLLSPWHLDLSENQTNFHSVIYSDSLSALRAVDNLIVHNELALKDLIKTGRHIVFCLIPGHVGITGNEVVDKAAKKGWR